ncbi:hypothetical protein F5Y18DRAFT_21625 [Xylariaceae sp. FL1019]|nr:hypothetical protein F5Y18DRAFT_21625 [Xylariaceae sp. FL1019]
MAELLRLTCIFMFVSVETSKYCRGEVEPDRNHPRCHQWVITSRQEPRRSMPIFGSSKPQLRRYTGRFIRIDAEYL